MNLIKNDLKKLGIQHDNFFFRNRYLKKDLVNKVVKKLQTKKFCRRRLS